MAGSEADVAVFKELNLDLPENSIICADKAYTDYDYEDLLEEVGLRLKAQRKKNSKLPLLAWEEFLGKPIRQYVERERERERERDGLQQTDQLLPQEDPRAHAQRL